MIRITNKSVEAMSGRLAVYPRLECGPVKLAGNGEYSLKPGESAEFKAAWPEAVKPEDLLKFPAIACLAPGNPIISTLIFSGCKTKVFGVPAPFRTANFARERLVAENPKFKVRLDNGESFDVEIPAGRDNGRIPLIKEVKGGWAVAELAFCRYALAEKGEAAADADGKEWSEGAWSLVCEPCQARWVRGPEDRRENPSECMLKWSARAGKEGIYIGIKAEGAVDKDAFTMFFDTRRPELLGTPGTYYWASGSFAAGGEVKISKGETSKKAGELAGKWKKTEKGAFIELFIPYELMDLQSWPESGDLGFSIWWIHNGPGGTTHLMWSEDGHPWNTRWYGVLRLSGENVRKLPWMVRIK